MTSKKELIKEIKRLRTLHLSSFSSGFRIAALLDGRDPKPWLSHLSAMTDRARNDGYWDGWGDALASGPQEEQAAPSGGPAL